MPPPSQPSSCPASHLPRHQTVGSWRAGLSLGLVLCLSCDRDLFISQLICPSWALDGQVGHSVLAAPSSQLHRETCRDSPATKPAGRRAVLPHTVRRPGPREPGREGTRESRVRGSQRLGRPRKYPARAQVCFCACATDLTLQELMPPSSVASVRAGESQFLAFTRTLTSSGSEKTWATPAPWPQPPPAMT